MWFTEASALTRSFSGMALGLQLCAGLCERYWEHLHPQPEDGDQEQRIGNLTWLLNRIAPITQQLPVTKGLSGSFSLGELAKARQTQAALSRDSSHHAESNQASPGPLTPEAWMRSARETSATQLRNTVQALQECRTALAELERQVDAQLGHDGPGFSGARDALDNAADELTKVAVEVGALHPANTAPTAAVASDDVPASADPGASHGWGTPGPIRTRAQALAQLREVAEFFRQTEPHSPVAYLADKAVLWGNMPLHEWLRSVLKDHNALQQMEELLGVPRQD